MGSGRVWGWLAGSCCCLSCGRGDHSPKGSRVGRACVIRSSCRSEVAVVLWSMTDGSVFPWHTAHGFPSADKKSVW